MEFMDVVFLSRIQFALTIMFHYLFPPLSIGLGVLLVIMEGLYLKTGDKVYEEMTKFWVKVFALVFGLGVASGIVMEFQFGTNWATYSRFVGDIFGSALAAEGIFAFFLESGFLAILVFGWNKVSPKMHFFSTIMVSLGSMFSAVWIVVANSWMQTPAGFHLVGRNFDGSLINLPANFQYDPTVIDQFQVRAEVTDFWAMVFNPSSMIRLVHTLIGAFILGSFVVMSVSAWYHLKGRHLEFAKRSFTIALVIATFFSLSQLAAGHYHAEVTAEYQPVKLAAFEGLYETQEGAPLHVFGITNDEEQRVDFGLAIPKMLSFLVHWDFNAPVAGLNEVPKEDWPPVQIAFQTYHIMIGLGMFFIALTLFASFLRWKGTLFEKRWLMWTFVFAVVLPYVANFAGWTAAEVGRQPWIVQDLLRTSDGVSKAVSAEQVLASIIMFTLIYILLFCLFVFLLHRKIMHGPIDVTVAAGAHSEEKGFLASASDRGPGQRHMLAPKAQDSEEEK